MGLPELYGRLAVPVRNLLEKFVPSGIAMGLLPMGLLELYGRADAKSSREICGLS